MYTRSLSHLVLGNICTYTAAQRSVMDYAQHGVCLRTQYVYKIRGRMHVRIFSLNYIYIYIYILARVYRHVRQSSRLLDVQLKFDVCVNVKDETIKALAWR